MFGKRPASMQLHTWPVSPSGSLSPERSSILWGFLRKPSLSRTSFETVGTMERVPQAPGGTRVSSGRVETRGSSRQCRQLAPWTGVGPVRRHQQWAREPFSLHRDACSRGLGRSLVPLTE